MSFKDIFDLELCWPICWAEQNHFCNFGRGHHEEQFCEIIYMTEKVVPTYCNTCIFLIIGDRAEIIGAKF